MALAKALLRRNEIDIADVAEATIRADAGQRVIAQMPVRGDRAAPVFLMHIRIDVVGDVIVIAPGRHGQPDRLGQRARAAPRSNRQCAAGCVHFCVVGRKRHLQRSVGIAPAELAAEAVRLLIVDRVAVILIDDRAVLRAIEAGNAIGPVAVDRAANRAIHAILRVLCDTRGKVALRVIEIGPMGDDVDYTGGRVLAEQRSLRAS